MTRLIAWLKRTLTPDDSVVLLPPGAGYCALARSHRHCVSKDPALAHICLLCGDTVRVPQEANRV